MCPCVISKTYPWIEPKELCIWPHHIGICRVILTHLSLVVMNALSILVALISIVKRFFKRDVSKHLTKFERNCFTAIYHQ